MSDDPAAAGPIPLPALPAPAADGTLVVGLMPPAQPRKDCGRREPDLFHPEIIVCEEALRSARIGPKPLPEVDDFGNAIPRAQLRPSDTATAQANLINQRVGGFNANGAEV